MSEFKMDADDAEKHFMLGILLSRSKRYEEAEKEYREAIRLNPNYAEAHNNLGMLWFEYNLSSMCDEIEKEYRKAIEINPNYAEAHYNLGVILVYFQRYEEAEEEFRKAIQINPCFALAHLGLGILLLSDYRKEEAEEEILKARVLFEKQGKVKGVDLCDEILNNLDDPEFVDPIELDKLFFSELCDLQDKFQKI